MGWAAEVGGKIIPLKVYVTRAVGDADGDTPQVVVVAERKADNVGFLFDISSDIANISFCRR